MHLIHHAVKTHLQANIPIASVMAKCHQCGMFGEPLSNKILILKKSSFKTAQLILTYLSEIFRKLTKGTSELFPNENYIKKQSLGI